MLETGAPRPILEFPRGGCIVESTAIVQFASEWAASSVGRASRSQRGGRGFESPAVHQPLQPFVTGQLDKIAFLRQLPKVSPLFAW